MSFGDRYNMKPNPAAVANTITTSRIVPIAISRWIRLMSAIARVIMSPIVNCEKNRAP